MGTRVSQSSELSFSCNILITKEDGLCVAHCLELDIVATGITPYAARHECVSLVCAQIEYAFVNDNMQNLYHSAPQEVWEKFYACKAQTEEKYKIEQKLKKIPGKAKHAIIPPLADHQNLSRMLCLGSP